MKTRTSDRTNWHEAADYARFARYMMRRAMDPEALASVRRKRKQIAVYGFMLASGVGSRSVDRFLGTDMADIFAAVYNEWKAGLHKTK